MTIKQQWALCFVTMVLLLGGCANPALRDAERLRESGQHEAALQRLETASREQPDDVNLKNAVLKQRDSTLAFLLYQAETARAAGQAAELQAIVTRAQTALPGHPRVEALREELLKRERHGRLMSEARAAMSKQEWARAESALRAIISETPRHSEAKQLLSKLSEQRSDQTRKQSALRLLAAHKPVTLEFREAALRTVFEALARAAQISFVFDKDVRVDARVTLFLRNTGVEEAMKVILNTQQLGYKLLNDSTVLIFPNTSQKQRELLDTVTRSFYLVNADPKQAQNLIRTVAKSRDIFIDERLNLIIVRDTPEVVRLIERLIANIDLPDPEVMLELEVMEVSSKKVDELGLNLPQTAVYGIPGGTEPLTSLSGLRWSTTNPLAVATLRGTNDTSNLLANPKIRARNREKAKISLGERLPVFSTTTTSTTAVSNTVNITYVDVGLKLELEPQVQLNDEVIIKVQLEVSNITNKVSGPEGSLAYQVGSRVASTSLRLKDGETQVLGGLISDDESRNYAGLPGIQDLPLLNRLLGKNIDERKKTEVVLLITPRIVRNLNQESLSGETMESGTEAQPGATPFILMQGQAGSDPQVGPGPGPGTEPPQTLPTSSVRLTGPELVAPGVSFQVTVFNPNGEVFDSAVLYDPSLFDPVGNTTGTAGRWPIKIEPQANQVLTFKVNQAATNRQTEMRLEGSGAVWGIQIGRQGMP